MRLPKLATCFFRPTASSQLFPDKHTTTFTYLWFVEPHVEEPVEEEAVAATESRHMPHFYYFFNPVCPAFSTHHSLV